MASVRRARSEIGSRRHHTRGRNVVDAFGEPTFRRGEEPSRAAATGRSGCTRHDRDSDAADVVSLDRHVFRGSGPMGPQEPAGRKGVTSCRG